MVAPHENNEKWFEKKLVTFYAKSWQAWAFCRDWTSRFFPRWVCLGMRPICCGFQIVCGPLLEQTMSSKTLSEFDSDHSQLDGIEQRHQLIINRHAASQSFCRNPNLRKDIYTRICLWIPFEYFRCFFFVIEYFEYVDLSFIYFLWGLLYDPFNLFDSNYYFWRWIVASCNHFWFFSRDLLQSVGAEWEMNRTKWIFFFFSFFIQ